MSDDERLERLTEMAKRVWPDRAAGVEATARGAGVYAVGERAPLIAMVLAHPRALDALEAALLVLLGEAEPPLVLAPGEPQADALCSQAPRARPGRRAVSKPIVTEEMVEAARARISDAGIAIAHPWPVRAALEAALAVADNPDKLTAEEHGWLEEWKSLVAHWRARALQAEAELELERRAHQEQRHQHLAYEARCRELEEKLSRITALVADMGERTDGGMTSSEWRELLDALGDGLAPKETP